MRMGGYAWCVARQLCPFVVVVIPMFVAPGASRAEAPKTIKLNVPDLKRGRPFMETLSVKASAQEWSDRELSLQDLSDLLWAANGINRPDVKKYTASSAMNAHDVDLYVFLKDGAYLYDADSHALNLVLDGDHRAELMRSLPPRPEDAGGAPPPPPRPSPSNAPVQIILVSDSTRFRAGTPELKFEWGALDSGIVSQNISLFCAATGLKTRPRASMDRDKIKSLLQLKDTKNLFLNHPVGYAK
jgi:nitroreductase